MFLIRVKISTWLRGMILRIYPLKNAAHPSDLYPRGRSLRDQPHYLVVSFLLLLKIFFLESFQGCITVYLSRYLYLLHRHRRRMRSILQQLIPKGFTALYKRLSYNSRRFLLCQRNFQISYKFLFFPTDKQIFRVFGYPCTSTAAGLFHPVRRPEE